MRPGAKIIGILAGAVLIALPAVSLALTPEVERGLNYLLGVQNPDGSWASASSLTHSVPATATAMEAISFVTDSTSSSEYIKAASWLNGQGLATTYDLAERIRATSALGADANALVSYADDAQFAWGGAAEYDLNILDTAIAVKALDQAGYVYANSALSSAISFLTGAQNADGGWGFYSGEPSSAYVTSYVVLALGGHNAYTSVGSALSKARDYLLARQNSDGGFGSSPSTVYETALSYFALRGLITDETVLGNAVNYLRSAQGPDGSWEGDPYQSALALRALATDAEKPAEPEPEAPPVEPTPVDPPVPDVSGQPSVKTFSTVTGTVRDIIGAPIAGAVVSITGTGLSAISGTDGGFSLSDITLLGFTITATAPGYAETVYRAENIGAYADYTAEIILIKLEAMTLTGIVRDLDSGLPIIGATVSIEQMNLQTQTAADGSYTLTGMDSMEFLVKASAPGYNSRTYPVTLTGSGTFTFDIAIYKSDTSIKIISLTPDSESYGAYSVVKATAVIENTTNEPIEAMMLTYFYHYDIQDSSLPESFKEWGEFRCDKAIVIAPGTNTFEIDWNTNEWAPGTVIMELDIIKGPVGDWQKLFASEKRMFKIVPTKRIEGAINVNPPVTHIAFKEPVAFAVDILNIGNVTINSSVVLTVSLDGLTAYTKSAVIAVVPSDVQKISLGEFFPLNEGTYDVEVRVNDPDLSEPLIGSFIVGEHVRGTFTLEPSEGIEGDINIIGRVSLKGFTSLGSSTSEIVSVVPLKGGSSNTAPKYEIISVINLPDDYSSVTFVYASFDDNGMFAINDNVIYENSDGCCSAGSDSLSKDITGFVHPGENELFTYVDNCCGIFASADLRYKLTRWGALSGSLVIVLPEEVKLNASSPAQTSTSIGNGNTKYIWDSLRMPMEGNEVLLDLTFPDAQAGEKRPAAVEAYIEYKSLATGESLKTDLTIPSLSVIEKAEIDASEEKNIYRRNENVDITVRVKNYDKNSLNIDDFDLRIEDNVGRVVAMVQPNEIPDLTPYGPKSYKYRIPVAIDQDWEAKNEMAAVVIDFADVFNEMGISDESLDPNSIVVYEYDKTDNVLEFRRTWSNNLTETEFLVEWFVEGVMGHGKRRDFYIYFDTLSNGQKQRYVSLSKPSISDHLIAYVNNDGGLYTIEYNDGIFNTPRFVEDMSTGNDYSYGITVNDFNKDGFPDIVTGSAYTKKLYIYLNKADGNNNFEQKQIIGLFDDALSSFRVCAVASGDLNGDENIDLVISVLEIPSYLFQVYTFMGNGDGSFKNPVIKTIIEGYSRYYMAIDFADFDEDGDLDMVANTYYRDATTELYRNSGDGTMEFYGYFSYGHSMTWGLSAGDFYKDDNIDFITNTKDGVRLYYGDGSGQFTNYKKLNLFFDSGTAFSSIDINSDGFLDLFATNYSSKEIEFYYSKGYSGFKDKLILADTGALKTGIDIAIGHPEIKPTYGSAEIIPVPEIKYRWNTQSYYPGIYTIRTVLREGAEIIAEDSDTFTIKPDQNLSFSIWADKEKYNAGDTVEIGSVIQSTGGNYTINNLTGTIAIISQSGESVFNETIQIQSVVPGGIVQNKNYWDSTGSKKGQYQIIFTAYENGIAINTVSAVIEILGTASTGQGIIGQITASPDVVNKGDDESVAYTIENKGNEDISGLNVAIRLIDPESKESLETHDKIIDLVMGDIYTGNLKISTDTLDSKDYIVILEVKTSQMTAPKTIGRDVFKVKQGLEADKSIKAVRSGHVLVWLNYNWNSCAQDGCPDVQLIREMLSSAGWGVFIVFDKKDFQDELRNPIYTDYVILGDSAPLENHFAAELREKVFSGRGLISAKFSNNQALDERVFGVKFNGNLKCEACSINISDSDVFGEQTYSFAGDAVNAIPLEPEDKIASISWLTRKGLNETAGIVSHQYGLGRSIFFSFDLAMAVNNNTALSSLMDEGLEFVHSSNESESLNPYEVADIQLDLRSMGGEFNLKITETLPETMAVFNLNTGEWTLTDGWNFNLSLGENESRKIIYPVLVPEKTGVYTLETLIENYEGNKYSQIASLTVDVTVEKDMNNTLQDALFALQTLQVTPEEGLFVAEAISHLNNIQLRTGVTLGEIEENIHDTIMAIHFVLQIRGTETEEVNRILDNLLFGWEGRWYFSQPKR